MPLNSIGLVAGAGSSGAVAREARVESVSASSANSSEFSPREIVVSGDQESSVTRYGSYYVSPFIRLDTSTRLAILEFRDSETGEVQQQYPSPRAVKEYAQNLPDNFDLPRVGGKGRGEDAPEQAPPSFGKPANEPTGEVRIIGAGSGAPTPQPVPQPAPTGGTGRAPSNPAIAAFSAALSGLTSGFSSRQVAVA
ncbi:hypothetical protein [Ferrovibrio sp.]|uniref:hypothetical protein n=1 Tax=Ferrovibrio sp. TaxID=1917215 RepID=UPI001B6E5EC3|nr:hypothetical protein [Ferrovibrio sp.]MBP7066597.1 hypothetical protein [Ferrovibrio sp.]